jgi:hypothetical protein
VRTRDNAGNWASGAYHIGPFRIDTTPPSTPSPDDGVSGWSNDNTPTFSWSCSDLHSGVAGCWWKVNSGPETWIPGPGPYTVTLLAQSDGSHTFYVRCKDNAGNIGSWGAHSFQIDATPPTAPSISSPTHPDQNAWYSNNDPTFEWTTPSDTSGIVGYSYILDKSPSTTPGETISGTGNSASYTDLADGTWYFHVRAKDNAGNWGSPSHYRVNIASECIVTFYTDPAGLSFNITFKGQTYHNNTIGAFTNGTSGLATANAPSGWVLDHWEATGNVKVWGEKSNPTNVTITCGGTLKVSIQDNNASSNLGIITFDGSNHSLPKDINKSAGTYPVQYAAASGYKFDHWETTLGITVADPNLWSTTATVTESGTLRAVYKEEIISYTVHLESMQEGNASFNLGTITFDGTTYNLPKDISKSAGNYSCQYTPASGYQFVKWETSGGVSVPSATANPTTVTVSNNGTLRALYKIIQCQVTFYTEPAGLGFNITFLGQTYHNNTTGTFPYGTSNLATANAAKNWTFDHWEATGNIKVSSMKDSSTTVTITCGGTLKAIFKEIPLGWDVVLTASKEGYSDASDFGVRSDATDGFDPACDEIDPPAPPVGVVSYFWYPNNPSSPVDLRKLSTSKIPLYPLMTWTYKVKPVAIDGTMTISWTAQDISAIPPEYYVFLLNSEGKIVANMRAVTEYSFTAASDTAYTFTIYVGRCYFELRLSVGWNMVSFPCLPEDPKFSNILSGVGYYQVLTWNGTSYIKPVIAEAGRGYWILVLEDTTVTIYGLPVERYELDLPASWSMIGSIYDCTVNANLVFPGWYQLLTWNGTSYVKTATIEPGKGYWVCVLQPTHIVVDKSKVMTSPKISSTTLSRTYDRYAKDEGQIADSRIAYNKRLRTLFTRRSGANCNLQTS